MGWGGEIRNKKATVGWLEGKRKPPEGG